MKLPIPAFGDTWHPWESLEFNPCTTTLIAVVPESETVGLLSWGFSSQQRGDFIAARLKHRRQFRTVDRGHIEGVAAFAYASARASHPATLNSANRVGNDLREQVRRKEMEDRSSLSLRPAHSFLLRSRATLTLQAIS